MRRLPSASVDPPPQLDLPALRQAKGITLREIADTTKISLRFLLAIEEGNFEILPGGIYNTSYIRQYARAIGCEESDLLAYYNSVALYSRSQIGMLYQA